jgi:teichuronic acid biosynthesis glycosyltransferase TuaC
MKLLFIVPYYPHAGHPFAGIFNERTALALRELGVDIQVLVPRPYAPPPFPLLSSRWRAYAQIEPRAERNGIRVHRPAYIEIPRFGAAVWRDLGAFITLRQTVRRLHRECRFDAILSMDLFGAGGLAWRLGCDLGVPACGWATGSDMAQDFGSAGERLILRALNRLDVVFYQSRELFDVAASFLRVSPGQMDSTRHRVLARGILPPKNLPGPEKRAQIRQMLGIAPDGVLVMNIGRVVHAKGIHELLISIKIAASQDPRITCVIVGCKPGFDESQQFRKQVQADQSLSERIKFLPGCNSDEVWSFLSAADIFAFPSHQRYEGMPNSVLEAMAMGLPTVAFGIPPLVEIEAGRGGIRLVPTFDIEIFAQSLVEIAKSEELRSKIGVQAACEVQGRFLVKRNMAVAIEHLSAKMRERSHQSCAQMSLGSRKSEVI